MKKKRFILSIFMVLILASCSSYDADYSEVELSGDIGDALVNDDPISSTGTDNLIVVPVELNSQTYTTDMLSDIDIAFNGTEDETGYYSLSDYISISSYDKLNVTADVIDTIDLSSQTYDVEDDYSDIVTATETALSTLDLSSYDVDDDSYIDSIYIVYLDETGNTYTYLDRYDRNFTEFLDIEYGDYNIGNVTFLDYNSIIVDSYSGYYDTSDLLVDSHEIIHQFGYLLGLQDTYDFDTDEGSDGGEYLSTMMSGICGDYSSLDKILLGWATVYYATGTGILDIDLDSFETSGECVIYSNHTITSIFDEYVIFENYTNELLNSDNSVGSTSSSFSVIKLSHADANINTTSSGKSYKSDSDYDDSAYKYNNSDSEYLFLDIVLTNSVEEDTLTEDDFYTDLTTLMVKFHTDNEYHSFTFGMDDNDDGGITLELTV